MTLIHIISFMMIPKMNSTKEQLKFGKMLSDGQMKLMNNTNLMVCNHKRELLREGTGITKFGQVIKQAWENPYVYGHLD